MAVILIKVPALNDRREDIPLLIDFFTKKIAKEQGSPLKVFSSEAIALLQTYDWTGNIRELRNVVERLIILGEQEVSKDDVEALCKQMRMQISIFQIDAFTDVLFGGNPAAVCPLEYWLDDHILQQIAAENNLAETAFFVKESADQFHLRWFTPEIEMDLCGHATLASAYVLFEELGYSNYRIEFKKRSGALRVEKENDLFVSDFPSRPPKQHLPKSIKDGLNLIPDEVWKSRDYVLVYEREEDVKRYNLT